MHCAICDKEDDSVTPYNTDCSECQEVIYDTLQGYGEYEDEDEISVEFVDIDVDTIGA